MMIGPRTQRTMSNGVVDVYPLAIPAGEGLSIPVKFLGEIGFYNLRGFLVLVVPPALVNVLAEQLAPELAAGEAQGPRLWRGASGANVMEFAVRLRPGMRKAIPLGSLGEFAVEGA